MDANGLQQRVADLEWRLARIEAAMGLEPPLPQAPPAPQASSAPQASPAPQASLGPQASPRPIAAPLPTDPARPAAPPPLPPRAIAAPPPPDALEDVIDDATDDASPEPEDAAVYMAPPAELHRPAPVIGYAPAPAAPIAALREGEWEQTIGLKWAGWVGAVVLIIGAALAVKYGYEMWFRHTPPAVRVATIGLFGFALIAAGEWVYRRVHAWSAVGLFGAGVATLFICAYTGHGVFNLYSRDIAFVFMGIATVIGAAVSVRGRLVSIGVLALIGGNIAPLILGGDPSRLVAFLAYLLMLQVVALVLAWWGRDRRWWTIRWLSLATTALWMASLILPPNRPYNLVAAPLVFSILFALLYQAELILSALRRDRADDTDAHAGVFSALVTALLLGATLGALQDHRPLVRGAWVIAYALITLAAGFALARSSARTLSLALRIQAAALVIIAVPVALSGTAVPIAWSVLAIAFGILGWQRDLHISRIAAVFTWLAAVWYVPWGLDHPHIGEILRAPGFTLAGVDVPIYAALMAGVVAAGHVVAWLISAVRLRRMDDVTAELITDAASPLAWQRAWLLSAVASAAWIIVAISAFAPLPATVAILLYAWLLVAGDWLTARLRLAVQALAIVSVAACKWALVDLLAQRMGQGWTTAQLGYAPLANPLMLVGGAVAASIIAIWLLRRRRLEQTLDVTAGQRQAQRQLIALAALVTVIVTIGLSLEIDRVIEQTAASGWNSPWRPWHVRQLCWTMLWTVATLVLGGIIWRVSTDPQQRHDRLVPLTAVPILLTLKFVTLDTLAWRIMTRVPGPAVGNIEVLTAAVLLAAIALGYLALRGRPDLQIRRSRAISVLAFAGLLLVLFTGSLEIDRGVGSGLARQVGFSIWWSAFALATIVLGFTARAAALRYFGLALFALTVIKVFFIDLQGVGTGWRTLSFIGLGLLLLGTSVLYGKFSPKLLAATRAQKEIAHQ